MAIDLPEVMDSFRIQVHGLKSTSKMIGLLSLSGLARLCELAAKENNIDRVKVLTPILIEELNKYIYEGETAELMGLLEEQIRNISLTDAGETIEKLLKK